MSAWCSIRPDVTHNTLDPERVTAMNGCLPKVQYDLASQYDKGTSAMTNQYSNKRQHETDTRLTLASVKDPLTQ